MFKEVVFRWTFDGHRGTYLLNLTDSLVFWAGDFPWWMSICEEKNGNFFFMLRCNQADEWNPWKCEHSSTITILNSSPENNMVLQFSKTLDHVYGAERSDVEGDKLLGEGFVVDGKVSIEARINIKTTLGARKQLEFDFTSPGIGSDDIVLVIEGKRVHVSRHYLAMHSPVFAAMFFKEFEESGKSEIELPEISYGHFIELLYVIYPSYRPITHYSFRFILALADRFNIKYAMNQAEAYLTGTWRMTWRIDLVDKLVLADKYRLEILREHCLQQLSPQSMKLLQDDPDFQLLSLDMKSRLLTALLAQIE